MFHVSTLLPYSTSNSQQVQRSFLSCFVFSPPHSTLSASFFQLERKRHVGNDIVVVIFQEGNTTPFSPAFMRTHFNRANLFLSPLSRLCSPFFLISPSFIDIFVIVRREVKDSQTRYRSVLCLVAFFFFFFLFIDLFFSRVAVCTKDSVPAYGPPLPDSPYFEDRALLRKFLITKREWLWSSPKTFFSHRIFLQSSMPKTRPTPPLPLVRRWFEPLSHSWKRSGDPIPRFVLI